MNVTNNKSINFNAKISPNLKSQLYRQSRQYGTPKKLNKALCSKMQDVLSWGTENAEIVVCKNARGYYTLGIKLPLNCEFAGTWAIEHLSGKTELSQFLGLTEEHIKKTEDTINYLYKKRGTSIFERLK